MRPTSSYMLQLQAVVITGTGLVRGAHMRPTPGPRSRGPALPCMLLHTLNPHLPWCVLDARHLLPAECLQRGRNRLGQNLVGEVGDQQQ